MKDKISQLTARLRPYRHHILAAVLIAAWCAPYLTSGQRIEWGDFSFFAQGYEAIRISILEYHQFPWWNPWISGGVPLYANPQMGVFSIQTIFVMLFGSVMGLKIALSIYTLAGYASMFLLLRKYFKVEAHIATLLSLLWIFCTFFVAHLPPHVTFAWYMLAPFYIYLALTLKDWRGGLWLGGAFAIMALSQIHNAFVHISVICGLILTIRLIAERAKWRGITTGIASAVGIFVAVAGHRVMLVFQNYQDFPRELIDPWARRAILGPLLPFSQAHGINFPTAPLVPGGLIETTASIGICATLLFFICLVVSARKYWHKKSLLRTTLKKPFIVLLAAASAGMIALGPFAPWAPYSLLKHLPVLSTMRVSPRWFIWFCLTALVFIALIIGQMPKQSKLRTASITLLVLGVLELFALNLGYQNHILNRNPVTAPRSTAAYTFGQTLYLGHSCTLPNKEVLPQGACTNDAYREYEATTFNLGTLYANDAFVQLALTPAYQPGHPTCAFKNGCGFVTSGNAKVTYWSPQRITLERTGSGPIRLNMNNSNYFIINGKRDSTLKVAEPLTDFVINEPESTRIITLTIRPSFKPHL